MVKAISRRAFFITTGLALVFVSAALFTSPKVFLEHLRLVQAALSTAVAVAYAPFAWGVFMAKDERRSHQLALGVTMVFLASAINGIWMLGWRLADKPIWMLDSDLQAFTVFLTTVGAALHLTAPGAVENKVPRRNWIILGCCVASGVLVALLLLRYDPKLTDWANTLEPYLSHDYRYPLLDLPTFRPSN